jgi:hypothetical protein
VAKTIFAGKQVEKFAAGHCFGFMRTLYAILPRFAENFFVGNGPCDAGYRDSQDK